jgi:hypothetical protein
MKTTLPALLLLLAACASRPPARAHKISPLLASDSTFEIAPGDLSGERVTTRLKLLPLADGESEDALLRTFEALVAPGTWGPSHRTALYREGDELVVRHAKVVTERLAQVVETLAAHRDRQVRVSARFLTISADQASDLENLTPAAGALAGAFDRAALGRLIDGWIVEGATALTAPRLTLLHGRRGEVLMANQFAYVAGYEPRGGWDPVVGVAQEGLAMSVATVVNGPRHEELVVALSVELSRLQEEPPRVMSLRFGDRVVELPGLASSKVEGRFVLRANEALLVLTRGPVARGGGELLAIAVEAGFARD